MVPPVPREAPLPQGLTCELVPGAVISEIAATLAVLARGVLAFSLWWAGTGESTVVLVTNQFRRHFHKALSTHTTSFKLLPSIPEMESLCWG